MSGSASYRLLVGCSSFMRSICTSLLERRPDQLRLQCSKQYEEKSLYAHSILRPKRNECKCKYQSSKEVKPTAKYDKQGRP